jgi:hypothetical protein
MALLLRGGDKRDGRKSQIESEGREGKGVTGGDI